LISTQVTHDGLETSLFVVIVAEKPL
jgi:hypothetical protein